MSQIKPEYVITEDLVKGHAIVVYDVLKEHQEMLYKLTNKLIRIIGEDKAKIIKDSVGPYLSTSYSNGMNYSEDMLDNDNFRVEVIYHLCLCMLTDELLSWPAYNVCKSLVFESLLSKLPECKSAETALLELFKVSPKVLPESHRQYLAKLDEVYNAIEIIVKDIANCKKPDEFMIYEDYISYIDDVTKVVREKLLDQGYYNVHNQNIFKIAIALSNLNGPPIIPLYTLNELPIKVDNSNLENLVSHLWELYKTTSDDSDDHGRVDGEQL